MATASRHGALRNAKYLERPGAANKVLLASLTRLAVLPEPPATQRTAKTASLGFADRFCPGALRILDDEVLPVLQACTTPAAILHAATHPDEGPAELLPTRLPLALAWCEGDSALEHFYVTYD